MYVYCISPITVIITLVGNLEEVWKSPLPTLHRNNNNSTILNYKG